MESNTRDACPHAPAFTAHGIERDILVHILNVSHPVRLVRPIPLVHHDGISYGVVHGNKTRMLPTFVTPGRRCLTSCLLCRSYAWLQRVLAGIGTLGGTNIRFQCSASFRTNPLFEK